MLQRVADVPAAVPRTAYIKSTWHRGRIRAPGFRWIAAVLHFQNLEAARPRKAAPRNSNLRITVIPSVCQDLTLRRDCAHHRKTAPVVNISKSLSKIRWRALILNIARARAWSSSCRS